MENWDFKFCPSYTLTFPDVLLWYDYHRKSNSTHDRWKFEYFASHEYVLYKLRHQQGTGFTGYVYSNLPTTIAYSDVWSHVLENTVNSVTKLTKLYSVFINTRHLRDEDTLIAKW